MARQITTAKPKDMKKTLLSFLQYMGHYKYSLFVVGIFVIISTGVNLWGTFQIRTVVNDYILALDARGFIRFVMLMAIVYALGALSTAIYKQLMVHTAQKIVKDIRQDLFNKMQKLPLKYFDSNAHGDLMSRLAVVVVITLNVNKRH